ncbi:MAG: hypothetical protein AMR96_00880 [Candidatus Adiutrix intracellularis]|nr:MAG: hypothetical protein AMR96_00880 [Candidatus Adiutrix intracellularis]
MSRVILNLKAIKTFLSLTLVLVFMACGVKTAPYPAAVTLPGQVRNLTQVVTEDGELILRWFPPDTNMVGRPLKSLGGFRIEMADDIVDNNYCIGCPQRYLPDPVDIVTAATPPPGLVHAPGPYEWRYRIKQGHVYHFRVGAASKNGGVHPESKVETVVWALPAPGALNFFAALGDKAVELTWSIPSPGCRVEIEKKAPGSEWSTLTALSESTGHFSDLAVDYEKIYEYRGRLVKVKDKTGVQGPWSREFSIRVIDVTPPNPPVYLDAALDTSGVRLIWEDLTLDPDVAGYRVYRQKPGESDFILLTPVLLQRNTYLDKIFLESEGIIRYQVTAVDRSSKANESRPSPVADVYLDPLVDVPTRPE